MTKKPSEHDVVAYWLSEIEQAKNRDKQYRKDGQDVLKIYEADEEQEVPFNILFSNTETLMPALYSQQPRPVVMRRFRDDDPMGKAVSDAGRRTLLHHNTFYSNVADVVIDSGAQNTEVKNSILYNSGSGLINNGTSTTTATNQTSNPSFVNAAGSDFALSASSTAINAGTNIGYTYNGAAPDIGAHETWGCSSGEVGSVDATSLIITCTNNLNPPILPSTGITGMTARENGGAVTVNGCVRSGSNLIDCTLNASITGGTTVDFSYSTGTGNLTDSACIGSGTCASGSQRLNAITNQSVTNNVSGAPSTTLTQTYSRIHGLRGTEAAPVVKATSSYPVVVGGKVRIRLKVACTGGDCDALGMALRYSKNGGSYTAVPDSFDADNIAFIGNGVDPDIPASGTATTEQLTSDHSSMVACAIVRTSGAIPNIDLSQDSETECEYAVSFDTDTTAGDTYDFRLYNQNGNALDAYSVTPRITVTAMAASGGR